MRIGVRSLKELKPSCSLPALSLACTKTVAQLPIVYGNYLSIYPSLLLDCNFPIVFLYILDLLNMNALAKDLSLCSTHVN